ncbi:flagellar biosynthesis anti-sigma factor FlgM [Granulicella cerasi]|uniref:Negative regulator of flagellin synthesis n=1 Tax=Granulicella cerasi TaxID=741063 RepID=A0ABW1Z4I2_9BACT|nr:flagellar biosynthesis anti-sigma factor FlgM [Granulicella cerasi]
MTQINSLQMSTMGLSTMNVGESDSLDKAAPAAAMESTSTGSVNASAPSTVVVSNTGNLLSQNVGDDDIRADKVSALQAAITSGSYNVSASQVADKLMGFMMEGK